jgi:hypothetical protein
LGVVFVGEGALRIAVGAVLPKGCISMDVLYLAVRFGCDFGCIGQQLRAVLFRVLNCCETLIEGFSELLQELFGLWFGITVGLALSEGLLCIGGG